MDIPEMTRTICKIKNSLARLKQIATTRKMTNNIEIRVSETI